MRGGGARDLGIKLKGKAEQFSWRKEFHYSLCLNIFDWHQK